MRRSFLALVWHPENAHASDRAQDIGCRVEAESGWRRHPGLGGVGLWLDPAQPLPVRPMAGAAGLVLGDVFSMPGVDAGASPLSAASSASAREVLTRLSRSSWGHYVALLAPAVDAGAFATRVP